MITSFAGVTLEVGGDVETYWKSTALAPALGPIPPPRAELGAARLSPSAHITAALASQALTSSSLRGEYLNVGIQVTRDLHPVVFSEWLLPETYFTLGVADVTLAQFEALAERLNRKGNMPASTSWSDWSSFVSQSMLSLSHLLKVLHFLFADYCAHSCRYCPATSMSILRSSFPLSPLSNATPWDDASALTTWLMLLSRQLPRLPSCIIAG